MGLGECARMLVIGSAPGAVVFSRCRKPGSWSACVLRSCAARLQER
jgi:hypothetical protein